jgi:protein phosphatase/serine/threonine-protein phosphatase Stp1
MGAIRSWSATDPGTVRPRNQDTFVDRPDLGLWAVADGAGGHEAGEVASGLIAEALGGIGSGLAADEMLASVRARMNSTHQEVRARAARLGPNAVIASTVVIAIVRRGHYAVLWAGDSRAYLLRRGELRQITRDHSYVQQLVDAGHLAPDQADDHPRANIITRALGIDAPALELDKVSDRLRAGDRMLLCSDGLNKTMSADRMVPLLASADPARALIGAALAAGARDNVTAVVLEALGDDAG